MVELIVNIALGLILFAGLLGAVRFFTGPLAFDRVVALDVLTVITISLIGLIAHLSGRIIYLDIAIVYGLLSFIAIIAIARYMERGL
jgi:multicomponent Na+:H+ antiporter subunit F